LEARLKPDADRPFLVRFTRSFGYALRGLAIVSRDRMFRCQLLAAIVVIALAGWLGATPAEWSILALTIGGVLALEAMNSAIETCVDLAMPEIHPLAAKAKDIAAGAVLIASIAAVVVGLCLLGPKLIRHLN
jgi:diacylglycerol kinase